VSVAAAARAMMRSSSDLRTVACRSIAG